MPTVESVSLAPATETRRKVLQRPATSCSAWNFGKVCKALWPAKTAEEFAARRGCSIRAAAYKIAGRYEIDGNDLALLVAEIVRRE